MKTLTQFLTESNINEASLFDANDELIAEGFWNKVGNILGYGAKKLTNAFNDAKDGFKDSFASGQLFAAKSKDNDTKETAKELADSVTQSNSTDEALENLAKKTKKLLSNKSRIVSPEVLISVKGCFSSYPEKKISKEIISLIDKYLEKHHPDKKEKAEETVQTLNKKVKKAGVNGKSSKNGKKSGEKVSDNKSTLGGEDKAVTAKQEEAAVTDVIKNDIEFFKPLAAEAKMDADQMRESIVNLINKSLKEPSKDKEGNTVYKWKVDTKGFQTKNEPNLIKGLGALLSGVIMINHKGMSEKIIDTLIGLGFSKSDILKALK